MENSLFCRCFPEEGIPLFGHDGNVPLSRAWISCSWNGILYRNVTVGCKQCTFVVQTIFFYQKIQFYDVSLKNYFVLYAKRNESGS